MCKLPLRWLCLHYLFTYRVDQQSIGGNTVPAAHRSWVACTFVVLLSLITVCATSSECARFVDRLAEDADTDDDETCKGLLGAAANAYTCCMVWT